MTMTRLQEHSIPCEATGCSDRSVFHLTWTQFRRSIREQHFCEEHAKPVLTGHDFGQATGHGTPATTDGAKCFDIELVVITERYEEQCIYLKEVGGNRYFPLLIGIFEATVLDRALKGFTAPRPLTHDAMSDAIDALDGKMQDVVIVDLKDNAYYADVRIRRYNQTIVVDMRPSDAFVLAVLENKPIFISDQVLAKIGL
jgi:uncharacterized protein